MNSKVFFRGLIIFQIFILIPNAISYKYGYDLLNENVFSPCEMDNVHSAFEYLDFSNIKFEFLDDGAVYVHGEAVLIKDIGAELNPVSIQIFKKDRDQWVGTVYNLKRADMCTALFNPEELWHECLKTVPQEARKCPMEKGTVFPFNTTSHMSIPDLPDPRLAGEYKAQFLTNLVGINEMLCSNILFNAYRL